MTRQEKINKLANAIKEFRGVKDVQTGKWHKHPKPSAKPRVLKWVRRLHLAPGATMRRINGFKTADKFHAWIRSLT